jgi:hypothetical protein
VDTSVTAAFITSGVALAVALASGVRSELRAASDRRYELRRKFLTDVQDATLTLRDALREYGSALRARTGSGDGAGGGIFIMSVPEPLATQVSAAEGRFTVATSRVGDESVVAALERWHSLARVSLIDTSDSPASDEADAFDEVNDLIGAALRSARGRPPR